MSAEKTILQYRAMGSRRGGFQVVGVYVIPRKVKPFKAPPRTARLKRYEYTAALQWSLTRRKAFAAANALNALNNLPHHEDEQK